jgi:hypothetical protein
MTSTTATSPESLIETDLLGRIKMPAALLEQLIDEFENASGQQFAKRVGVKCQAFAT